MTEAIAPNISHATSACTVTTHKVRTAWPTPRPDQSHDPLERNCRGVSSKYPSTQSVERDQKDELERIDHSVHQLNGGKIQTEYDSSQRAQDQRRTQHGRNAKNDAQRDRERDLFRRDTLAQQLNEGLQPTAVSYGVCASHCPETSLRTCAERA